MPDVVLLGGGGHARSVLAALSLGGANVRGYLAPAPSDALGDLLHLGADDELGSLDPEDVVLVNGLGTTTSTTARRTLHEAATARGFTVASVVHPHAFVDPGATLGPAVQVLAGVIVNVGAELHEGALVNSGAIIEHDTVVGAHAHVAPAAVLAGGVRVGDGALIGLGARVLPGITIGAGGVVGAGAVVVRDVAPGRTVAGVPARVHADRSEAR